MPTRYDSRIEPNYYSSHELLGDDPEKLHRLLQRLGKEKTSLNLQLAQSKATNNRLRARLKQEAAKIKKFKALYESVNLLVVRLTADNEIEIDSFDDVMNALHELDNGNFDLENVFKS